MGSMKIILILLFSFQTARASLDFLDNMICSTCRDVADNVEQFIEPMRDAAVEDIVEIVDQVKMISQICDGLPSLPLVNVREACRDQIESQLTAIVDGIKTEYLSPSEVCSPIMACTDDDD